MAGMVGMPTRHLHGLKKVRKDRKLSQRQLALLSGVTQVNLSRLENGQPATLPTTKKLARALKVPSKTLLGEEEPAVVEAGAIDLSDAAGTAFMGRVEAGEVEGYERNVKDKREKEILDMLQQFFPAVSKMRQYEPAEAARACLNWPSQERAKEAIEEMSDWLGQVAEEMRAMTTPGVLRAIGGKTNE
jgi:transcriptional regulator with XRE-family HTH domain